MKRKKRSELVEVISSLVSTLSEEEKRDLLKSIFSRKHEDEEGEIPISIFRSNLSGLEALTVYFKDIKEMSVVEIAKILNRKKSTIYTSLHKAKQKRIRRLDISDESVLIPPTIFSDRKFSILESLAHYMKDELKISFVEIAKLIDKKYSTIRTVYKRYQDKCKT